MTSVEDALNVHCPECEATPPNPCVYLPLKDVDPHAGHSLARWARIQQTGTPTLRPHNGRFNTAWQQKIKRARRAAVNVDKTKISQRAASPKLREIARAHQAWDRQEWLRLTVWLRRWGHIFKETS